MAATAKQKATDRLPFGGKSDTGDTGDGQVHPTGNGQASVNGARYTTDDS